MEVMEVMGVVEGYGSYGGYGVMEVMGFMDLPGANFIATSLYRLHHYSHFCYHSHFITSRRPVAYS